MWQEVGIIIIGIIVILYIGRKIYQLAHPSKINKSCCGCSGCTLKDIKRESSHCTH